MDAAEIQVGSTVLEIGTGLGALTCSLAEEATEVVTIEYDLRFIPVLEWSLGKLPNVKVIYGDFLELDLKGLTEAESLFVVANIPYNITSQVIRRLMESPVSVPRVVLTIQREVAERIMALPGSMNLLALSVQVYGEPEIIKRIPASSFYPKPKVDSAVIRIDAHSSPLVDELDISHFFRIAKAGFSQKRKQLKNSLSGGLGLTSSLAVQYLQMAGIDPTARAQELSIEDWTRLASVIEK